VDKASGGNPDSNPSLRLLSQKARQANMPADNIDRAIKRGTGELQGAALEEIMMEGFAPGGVALIIQILTDNRNRTVAEIRHAFTRHSGNLAGAGAVMRNFQRKGTITVEASKVEEDKLMELVLDAGAEDLKREGDMFEITTDPGSFVKVMEALNKAGIPTSSSEVGLVPDMYVPITAKEQASALLKFIEDLEDLDDVQNVYSNFDIDDALMEQLSKG